MSGEARDGAKGDGDGGARAPEEWRAGLVAKLRADGALTDEAVARALLAVPRHLFLPGASLAQAYADTAVPTHFGAEGTPISSASQPAIVAIMLQQLRPFQGMRVLEIGAGTGYNAALLAELAGPDGHVTSVDIDEEIAAEARAHLDAAGYPAVEVVAADGAAGWPTSAPYDRIELAVGASDISPAWVAQLREGGLLVLPLWMGAGDACVAFRKQGEVLVSEALAPCGFMRLRGAERDGWQSVTLPNGKWRLASDRTEEIAQPVAALLATRPRRRLWRQPPVPFQLYLGLIGTRLVALWPARERERARRRLGVYAEGPDGPSLALFAVTLPVLLSFGGGAAARLLEREQARWEANPVASLERWTITARPRVLAAQVALPSGVVRRERRHYAFDIQPFAGGEAGGE